VPTGIKHGTITVLCGTKEDSRAYEVTTYRADGTYTDARRPDHIAFASVLSEDLKRRDFTMNALAYDPLSETLVDEHGGLADLAESRIRTIGLAHDRFFEDGLRTVRACRFAAVLGFSIEHSTLAALGAPDIHARVGKVAVERFTDELWKGMAGGKPSVLIALLDQTGLMKCFLNASETDSDTLSSLDQLTLPSNRMSVWVRAASRDFPGGLPAFCGALKLSGKDTAYAERIVLLSAYTGIADADHRRLCAHIKRTCADPVLFLEDARELAIFRPDLETLLARFREILSTDPLVPADLALRGQDLKALGFEGPAIGAQIERMLDAVYADPAQNTPEKLTAILTAAGVEGP
jgi:tRNA nucleotidyltransferase (CCA-adding enzyme)